MSKIFQGVLGASLAFGVMALGQSPVRKAPTAEDWAAMAKLPDFNGVWEVAMGGGGGGRGAAPAGGAAGRGAAPAGRGAAPGGAPAAGGAAAGGRGAAGGGRGGGRGGAAGPSLTPEYAAKQKAEAAAAAGADAQTANCLPPGLPGIMGQPYPIEFILTPGKVTVISEAYMAVRHIYTDGRPIPEDPDPNFFGTSIGHWDGQTLVVDTVGLSHVARGLNFPYSDKLRIQEKFHLTDPETMSIETTVMDPEALTAPYTMAARSLRRHRSWTTAEYICEENNRNFVDEQGKAGVRLASPK
ncbi:MAG TPA: hypothetical protein VGN17_13405 [Bryobacteraceae bacterium]|jgi:hypothetical protein